jgi:hypothetical protein
VLLPHVYMVSFFSITSHRIAPGSERPIRTPDATTTIAPGM